MTTQAAVSSNPSMVCAVTELERHIRRKLGGQIHDIRLVVGPKGLILRGRTRTYYAKQLAQHLVMAAMDLPILANEIEVS